MKNIVWLFYRLRAMSPGEILYRVNKKVISKKNKILYKEPTYIDRLFSKESINLEEIDKRLREIFSEFSTEELYPIDHINIFNHRLPIFESIDWHKCVHGSWPKEAYSLEMDFKNQEQIGDIRFTWEINRHQFFPYLAAMYKATKEERYFNALFQHFTEWIKENPFLKGSNWSSPMEVAIRSYQWLIVCHILKDCEKESFRETLIRSIIPSIKYVVDNFSKHSSANNHLIIEAYICSIIGYAIKPVYNQQWFEKGYEALKEQMPMQNHKDGVNKEQALHYQAFVTDGLLQYNFFLKKINKKPISEDIIENSLKFMMTLGCDKNNFDFGDSDDAKLVSILPKEKNYYNYILILGSIYYRRKFCDFHQLPLEVQLIAGQSSIPEERYEVQELTSYKEGGYYIVNHEENILLYDIGELGFGSIAAHGHADALSFIYYYKGNPVFVDSGTYIYNVEKNHRDLFRGTGAHNTLIYNEENQSEIRGPFLWGKKAEAVLEDLEDHENYIKISGSHNGYKPYIHRRELQYIKKQETLIIKDSFQKEAQVNFIVHNGLGVEKLSNNLIKLSNTNMELYFYCNSPIYIEETLISKAFFTKEITKKLVIKKDFSENPELITIIASKKEHIHSIIDRIH